MASDSKSAGTRFPFINLEKALGRAKELFDADQKGREMALSAAFAVWQYSEKSSGGFQTIAALKMYGLLRAGDTRKVGLTDAALRYFRDEREEEKNKLTREFALKPKLISALWKDWRATPPADTIARSHLKTDRGLNDQGSRSLLSIYKENLAFTQLKADDKVPDPVEDDQEEVVDDGDGDTAPPPIRPRRETKIMEGERELTSGLLSKDSSFRLIVSGDVGVKELERLIEKLKIDKEILGETESQNTN